MPVLVLAATVFLVVQGLLLYMAWRPSGRPTEEAAEGATLPADRPRRGWELLWTLLPALGLLALVLAGLTDLRGP